MKTTTLVLKRPTPIVGRAFDEHFYPNVHLYLSMLEKKGFTEYAQMLRARIVRHTEEIENTGMRRIITMFQTGRLTIVLPEDKGHER